MNIVRWPIDPALKKETDEHYRTTFALSLADKEPMTIVKEITFDSVAPNITLNDVEQFVSFVDTQLLEGRIKGTGLEVGAGCGFFTSIFAKNNKVERMYGLEICENIVTELMPKIVSYVTPEYVEGKVIGCVGDFDHIQLQNDSVDFIFDFYSLHHSMDLRVTLKELYRVLKPGGVLFCFDKARANSLSHDDLEKLLDKTYSAEAKKNMGLPADVHHTRRMNGEKEYRLNDWKQAFEKAGLHTFTHYHIARIAGSSFGRFIKNLISKLPLKVQISVTQFLKKGANKNSLEESNKIYSELVNNFPKEISFMSALK